MSPESGWLNDAGELCLRAASGSAPAAYEAKEHGCGCQNRFGIRFWLVGEFTTHFRTCFSGDWEVHWGTEF